MSEQPPIRAWFKRKEFGGGATPANWKGWVATLVYVVVLTATALIILPARAKGGGFPLYLPVIGVETVLFLAFARWKSDGPWFG